MKKLILKRKIESMFWDFPPNVPLDYTLTDEGLLVKHPEDEIYLRVDLSDVETLIENL